MAINTPQLQSNTGPKIINVLSLAFHFASKTEMNFRLQDTRSVSSQTERGVSV